MDPQPNKDHHRYHYKHLQCKHVEANSWQQGNGDTGKHNAPNYNSHKKKLVTRNTTTEGDGNSDMMVKESKQERQ